MLVWLPSDVAQLQLLTLTHPTVFVEQVVAAIEDVDGVKKPLMKSSSASSGDCEATASHSE